MIEMLDELTATPGEKSVQEVVIAPSTGSQVDAALLSVQLNLSDFATADLLCNLCLYYQNSYLLCMFCIIIYLPCSLLYCSPLSCFLDM